MSEYSRPFGDSVKNARIKLGYSQKQLAELIDADERTIMNIEGYKANTTMEVLYPLIRVLGIDPREIFNHEMARESPVYHQLRTLIDGCSEEEAAALIPVCQTVINTLRNQNVVTIQEPKKSLLPE